MEVNQEFTAIKLPLKTLLRDPDKTVPPLLEYANRANTIVILAYQLVRLYLLYCFKENKPIPKLSKEFFGAALQVISFPEKKTKIKVRANLKSFYHEHFKALIPETLEIDGTRLSTVFQDISKQMETAFENNITLNFLPRLRKMVRSKITSEEKFSKLTKAQINTGVNKVMKALWALDSSKVKVPQKLEGIYQELLENYLPKQKFPEEDPDKANLAWDLKANWEDYVLPTFRLNREFESLGKKMCQPICLRSSAIPKSIPIDTNNLTRIFDCSTKRHKSTKLRKFYTSSTRIRRLIWNQIFKMDKAIFQGTDKWKFFYSLRTDGVSVSLLFQRKQSPKYQKGKKHSKKKSGTPDFERLISEYTPEERASFKDRPLIGGDPGTFNIINLVQVGDKKIQMKYTSRQIGKESYSSQNRKKRLKLEKRAGIPELNSSLGEYRSKTMNFSKFQDFIKKKLEVLVQTQNHYQQIIYRKQALRTYIYKEKSEAKFLNRIEEKFGKNCVIGWGNWSRRPGFKGSKPSPGIRLKRKVARRFTVVTVYEAYTSKICPYCGNELKNREYRKTKKKRKNKSKKGKIYRALVCEECCSLKNGSKIHRFMHRDTVGSINIGKILESEIYQGKRPEVYSKVRESKKEEMVVEEDPFSEISVCPPKKRVFLRKKRHTNQDEMV